MPCPLDRGPDRGDIRCGTCIQVTEGVTKQAILLAEADVRGIGRIPQPGKVAGLAEGQRMSGGLADLVGDGRGSMQDPEVGA